ncbi:MAG: hypothetical protein MUF34_34035 [Polyangiaceae bacterium]|jgi:hypothetical protein|nr:hypothetical protein [Polyangiaceae bacterium]
MLIRPLGLVLGLLLSVVACSETAPLRRDAPEPSNAGQSGTAGSGNEGGSAGSGNEGGSAGSGNEGGSAGSGDQGPSEAELAELAAAAKAMLSRNCTLECHDLETSPSGNAKSNFGSVMLVDRMIEEGRIVPGKPERSEIWKRIASGSMPTGRQALVTDEEKIAIKDWITAGAPDWRDYGVGGGTGH